ncbi:MAG: hypothetical protein HDT20_02900 [Oscillibacter sp.]|nr:hypothetical protein [Oscillibacter sp.]MBD5169062.1 hypothetical protein [Oscillibacter sp.]
MIKEVNCLHFLYTNQSSTGHIQLESKLQFVVQNPIDSRIPERAIVVKFFGSGDEERVKLECVCRVVFAFDRFIPDGEELVRRYQVDAYEAMAELVDRTLKAMGQNPIGLPEMAE